MLQTIQAHDRPDSKNQHPAAIANVPERVGEKDAAFLRVLTGTERPAPGTGGRTLPLRPNKPEDCSQEVGRTKDHRTTGYEAEHGG